MRILYDDIDELRTTFEERQHVLNCLEHRHGLEQLTSPTESPRNSTQRWPRLWEEVVNQELDFLPQGYFGPRTLTPIFECKFKDLSRRMRNAVEAQITNGICSGSQSYARGHDACTTMEDLILNKIWTDYRRGHNETLS